MWTVIVLMCNSLVPSDCLATGGPAFRSEAKCIANFEAEGAAYIQTTYPKAKVLGARCIKWGPQTST